MERKWMTLTAGILNLICGISNVIGGLVLIVMGVASDFLTEYFAEIGIPGPLMMVILFASGILTLILGALATIGGVFCLQRRNWAMALTGAIASFLLIFLMGLAALILTIMGRQQFNPTPTVLTIRE